MKRRYIRTTRKGSLINSGQTRRRQRSDLRLVYGILTRLNNVGEIQGGALNNTRCRSGRGHETECILFQHRYVRTNSDVLSAQLDRTVRIVTDSDDTSAPRGCLVSQCL